MNFSRKDFLRASLLSSAGLFPGLNTFGEGTTQNKPPYPHSRNQEQTAYSISVFSKHLQWLDYPKMAKTAADLGFDGIDLTVRPGGHVLPENAERDLPKAVAAVRDEGLEVYMISTAISDPDDPHTKPILKTAGELGIGHYRTDWFPYDTAKSIEQNLDIFASKLSRLAEINEQYGIQGDYQNHAGASFGSSIWDLWVVLNELNSEWIGSQYDIRHSTVEGVHSWENDFSAIHPYIGTLDIKDFHWQKTDDGSWHEQNVPLGQGMVNFPQYFRLLKKHRVYAPISIHYEYDLGGANHGATTLNIAEEEVLSALKQDLNTLDGWLKEAGLDRIS
ncbi:sugar phosphate isomerase/epimerase family protein [Fodinibius salsisoli]|uniref:Sugar phosphate isomerase/epimerase n=1 Tax=Fodinibius salsisoli TaxID=2820877 RepID=A0ABT3PP83_9BACT|nr:sugar phosphate isomerase/epimerase family protein [Fodinibius salsisoli]MCW9707664.1 sugar phosphate isomerase/epimerase [Fodinibius salsisoli]